MALPGTKLFYLHDSEERRLASSGGLAQGPVQWIAAKHSETENRGEVLFVDARSAWASSMQWTARLSRS